MGWGQSIKGLAGHGGEFRFYLECLGMGSEQGSDMI